MNTTMKLLMGLFCFSLTACGGGGGGGAGGGSSSLSLGSAFFGPSASPAASPTSASRYVDSPNFNVLEGISTSTSSPTSTSSTSGDSTISMSGSTITLDGSDYTFPSSTITGEAERINLTNIFGSIVNSAGTALVARNQEGAKSLIFVARGTGLTADLDPNNPPVISSVDILHTGSSTPVSVFAGSAPTNVRYEGFFDIFGIPASRQGGSSTLADISAGATGPNAPPTGILTEAFGDIELTVGFGSSTTITGTATLDRDGRYTADGGGTFTGGTRTGNTFTGLQFTGTGVLSGHDFTTSGAFYGSNADEVVGSGSNSGLTEVMGFTGTRQP